ncbi:ankyrin repeat domain-containing protein 7-like [Orussus abietinus]|uniref:ankyrin repeat domain-containing protein 7-like n=1 Tax=Orussus abietinus TaxID=222816 RepID=UPI0006251B70|nr:ankyrin repeat domain-containing protein 7-like [Orussus abietinus]
MATPLTAAIDRGDPQILSGLLEKVPTALDSTTAQPCGRTALMYASHHSRNPDVLQVLLKKGADPVKTDTRGWTGLGYAIAGERVKNLLFLLENGLPVDQPDFEGRTPLMVAVALSNLDVLNALLERGADVNAKDDAGFTALQLAILMKKRDAAIVLTEMGSDLGHPSPVTGISIRDLAEGIMPKSLPGLRRK